jgi:hypothetical protein
MRRRDKQAKRTPRNERAALADLRDEWELVEHRRFDGANVWIYRSKTRPNGTAATVVRMSKRDMKDGETIAAQLYPCTAFGDTQGVESGWLIVTTECSGGRAYWERPDLMAIEDLIGKGLCKAVIWRDVTRMARDRQTFLDHCTVLQQAAVSLYVQQLGRAVDWSNFVDWMTLVMQVEFAVFERIQTKLRMHGGIWTGCILTGKGGSGSKPFGFRRDADGWLQVDRRMWPWVKVIHLGLRELKREDDSGLPALRELLANAGKHLTIEQIATALGTEAEARGLRAMSRLLESCGIKRSYATLSQMLANRIYVDGSFSNEIEGITIDMKPVDIADPIPASVYLINQEILAQSKGTSIKTRLAEFALTDPLCCGTCADELTAYFPTNGRGPSYRHKHKPHGACAGLVLGRTEIETAVIQFLRQLDQDEELARTCLQRALAEDSDEAYWERKRQEKAELEQTLAGLIAASVPVLSGLVQRQSAVGVDGAEPLSGLAAVETYVRENGLHETLAELQRLQRQIEAFDAIAASQRRRRPRIEPLDPKLQQALAQALTEEVPDELEARVLRAKVLKDCLSKVTVWVETDEHGNQTLTIELRGPLGSCDELISYPIAPSTAAAGSLRSIIPTVQQSYDYLTVGRICQSEGKKALSGGFVKPERRRRREIADWVSPVLTEPRSAGFRTQL